MLRAHDAKLGIKKINDQTFILTQQKKSTNKSILNISQVNVSSLEIIKIFFEFAADLFGDKKPVVIANRIKIVLFMNTVYGKDMAAHLKGATVEKHCSGLYSSHLYQCNQDQSKPTYCHFCD